MIVVSDTSVISNLAAINQLGLLSALFGEIVIPEAVEHELVEPGENNPGAIEVQREGWFVVRPITNRDQVDMLLTDHDALDIGEAEAIVLALELRADLLLIDDGVGRRVARERGLDITGILGALLDAKERGLISAVRPLLDDLIHVAGFYIASSLYDYILRQANEEHMN